MGCDVAPRAGDRIAEGIGTQAAKRPPYAAHEAIHIVDAPELARGDPQHADEVGGVPQAFGVAFAEADAAVAREARVEGRIVHDDLTSKLGAGRAEGETCARRPRLDQLQSPGPDPAKHGVDAGACDPAHAALSE